MLLALLVSLPLSLQEPVGRPASRPPPALVIGQPMPVIGFERWIVAPKKGTGLEVGSSSEIGGSQKFRGPAPRWSARHEAKLVFRAPVLERLPLLAELARASSDRELVLVGWTLAGDEERAKADVQRLGETVTLGVPKEGELGPLSPELCVIGPSGELVWAGKAAEEKELLAAVSEALARPKAPTLDAPLVPELAGALADYWKGAWAKARTAAEKPLKKAAPGTDRLQGDAKRLLAAIDALEHALADEAQLALTKGQVHEAVEIEALLASGLPGPSARRVAEMLKDVASQSLQTGAIDDARKWLEIAAKRPLFFPERDDGGGERYARELEQFVKRSSNMHGPQQRALALVERWKQRKAK